MSKFTCIATNATSIQDAVSKGSRNAVGDMMPVLLATRMVMPVSRYGTEKAMTRSRPEFILSEVITMSASPLISSETRPFHCTGKICKNNWENVESQSERNTFFSEAEFMKKIKIVL